MRVVPVGSWLSGTAYAACSSADRDEQAVVRVVAVQRRCVALLDLSPERALRGADQDPASQATRRLVRTFQRVTSSMYASSGLNQTLQVIADGVIQLVGFRSAVVGVALDDGGFEYVAFNGPAEVRAAMSGAKMAREQWDWRMRNCVRWGSLCWIDHRVTWPDSMTTWIPEPEMVGARADDPDAWDPEDYLFAPLVGPQGEVLGVLSVDLPNDGRKPDTEQLEVLELFAESAALAVWHSMLLDKLHEQHQRSQYLATHDSLTGLANRAALNDATVELFAARTGPIGVFVIDLDNFKRINDTFGHAAGDEVLIVVARRLTRALRENDLLARTGGDEFVAVVADPDVCANTNELVERLRTAITSPIRGEAGTYRVSASIGASTMPAPVTMPELLKAADEDMYRIKHALRRRQQHRLEAAR
jgi:diguanylate cyclase (GGDEF)-like protein